MKLLLLGSGGREHAFSWKLQQSPLCEELYIAPGNGGTGQCGTNVALANNDFPAIKQFCLDRQIDMVIVGPEAPLVDGIVDYFAAEEELKNIAVIGPSKQGALLEGSKSYAKRFMSDLNIPTAAYREFTNANQAEGLEYLAKQTPPIVLKADGLAAGKGVLICSSVAEAQQAFQEMLGGKFGAAGSKVVVEEFLDGIEFSVFVLTDGQHYQVLPIAKDYKRIGEGDTGLNTGGMGAVSPVPFVDEALMTKVQERIIDPTIQGIHQQGINYRGFVFIGLIVVKGEPYVIEYNCRMGDPESEVVFPRLKSDLVALLQQTAEGGLADAQIEIDERAATTVFLVSGGYPEAYEKGKVISNWENIEGSIVFHAGTKLENGQLLTNGGRVLALTSYGSDFRAALSQSQANAERIQFDGKYFRRDIGFDL